MSMMQPAWTGDPAQQQQLAWAIAHRVHAGWRVESAPMPGQVVMVWGHRPNHILHMLLSVFTLGLWLPVWLLVAATSKEQRAVLSANPDGSVHDSMQPLPRPAGAAAPWYKQTWAITGMVLAGFFILIAISAASGA